jgi:signal transduction histidine kinase
MTTPTTATPPDFGDVIARRIRAAHREIASRWLQRLKALLPVDTNDIFPSDQILDHVPTLIQEIANYVVTPADAVVANTVILAKAHELGDLRFEQGASVHQLLREYRLLAVVLASFVLEQLETLAVQASSREAVTVLGRLNEAVFVLMQTTVDTFVGRYTTQIEEQTTRLEGFNRMVSHELRQPLSSLQYAVELLKRPVAQSDEQRARMLEMADRNVKRLGQLLDMLNVITGTEHDSPQIQAVDLGKVVQDALRQLREAADAKQVSLRSEIPSVMLTVDASRLELVLVNLIANGIKYRDPSKPEAFVEVSLIERSDSCTLCVTDNGLGIPDEHRPKIFRRFYRAHAHRDQELGNDGVGLGLAIAADCAKGLNASLTFESTEGSGTTFTLDLPRETNKD